MLRHGRPPSMIPKKWHRIVLRLSDLDLFLALAASDETGIS
jgi:hypothetical protein